MKEEKYNDKDNHDDVLKNCKKMLKIMLKAQTQKSMIILPKTT